MEHRIKKLDYSQLGTQARARGRGFIKMEGTRYIPCYVDLYRYLKCNYFKTIFQICHSKTQDFSKTRITIYVEAYARKVMATRKYNAKKKDQE